VRSLGQSPRFVHSSPDVGNSLLRAERDEVVARYSILRENQQMFASKHILYLPTEEELRNELARERDQIEARQHFQSILSKKSEYATFSSLPDGNAIKIRYVRPNSSEILPCVYYIHGGRMEMSSCFEGNYRTWARMIAARGVAVAMVEFRNSVHPSEVPEIAPFPAGLNDCISGLKWVHANAVALNIDPRRIIVAGESGGGNLTFAVGMKLKQDGEVGLIQGLYSLVPYIAGEWPLPEYPSSIENEGIVLNFGDNRATMAYGIEAFNARNPLAWPRFATRQDVEGLAADGSQRKRVRPVA
jgi:acetyl esterase/lipase